MSKENTQGPLPIPSEKRGMPSSEPPKPKTGSPSSPPPNQPKDPKK